MSTPTTASVHPGQALPAQPEPANPSFVRLSTRFGLVFAGVQLLVMVAMATLVLPLGGSPSDPALVRGQRMLDAATALRIGNYVFMISGVLLLGFLGAVQVRLRQADPSGVLATVGVAAGALLALIWPMAGMLHDVTLEAARAGTDLRLLTGWDAVAPFSLAFSVLPRVFFMGAVLLGLRASGSSPWLQRTGVVVLAVSVIGSATLLHGGLFPVLAVSTLGYELWVGALAWHWLRRSPR
jgi:hypothetical protein